AMGLKAKAVMDAGQLVSDDILLGMLEDRLAQDDARAGFILDGYPRNLAQADALDQLLAKIGQPLDAVVKLDVPNEAIIGRCEIRFKAEGRADDNPDTVRKRLAIYAEQTAPVADFYARRGKLQVVDGVGELDEITTRIRQALQNEATAAGCSHPATTGRVSRVHSDASAHSRHLRHLHGRGRCAGARARPHGRGLRCQRLSADEHPAGGARNRLDERLRRRTSAGRA